MDNKISISERFIRYMKNTKTSTHVYRAVLISIVVLGIIATLIIHNLLSDFFKDYEDSRPKHLAEEYFNQIFDDDNYELIYEAAGFDETSPVSADEFNRWFKQLVDGKKIRYAETSDGLSGNSKYIIYIDNEKLGEFLLIQTGIQNESGFEILAKGPITIELPTDNAYLIRVRKGSTVTANGKKLTDDYIVESGTLISGEYAIYSINCLVDKPDISVEYNGEKCYMINPENNSLIYTDEVLNDPVAVGVVTTIRAIKGHTVFVNGKQLDDASIIKGAEGELEGYFENSDKLEYVVYSYSGEAENVVIKDKNGTERNVVKIPGGNIYTDTSIGKSGTIEFMTLYNSIPTLNGIEIDEKYIVEKDIQTESCKYMYGNVKGITYNKYKIYWVGDQPTLSIKNKYNNIATLSEVDGILTEVIEYDSEALEKHSKLITTASHTYVKMMANDASEWETLRYFDPEAEIYALVRDNPQGFFTDHDSTAFIDSTVKNVYVYDDNTFSGSISFIFTVTRNGKTTEYPFDYTFYFRLVGEKYLIYNMINNG